MDDALALASLFDGSATPRCDAEALARALLSALSHRRTEIAACMQEEIGLNETDARESVEGCYELLRHFRSSPHSIRSTPSLGRKLEIRTVPWGTVVAILPQNAFLYLGLTVLLHALDAGNKVLLRSPRGCVGTATLLREALAGVSAVSIVEGTAAEVLEAFYASDEPGLIHYFGGSERIPDLLAAAFRAGKGLIADGQGNTWVYVAEGCDPHFAARTLCDGATRYGGQTCTSVNGAVIHPSGYEAVRHAVIDQMHGGIVAADVESVLATSNGALLEPGLVEKPDIQSDLVQKGIYGPALWITPGDEAMFHDLWRRNEFPLCAAVLGPDIDATRWTALPNLSRLVVNGDPSLEDPLEPWGGYPRSGNSSVTDWHSKYRRTVQVDGPV